MATTNPYRNPVRDMSRAIPQPNWFSTGGANPTTTAATPNVNPIAGFGLMGAGTLVNRFQELQPQRDRVLDVADTAVNGQLNAQSAASGLSSDLLARKEEVFNPVEDRIVGDAMAMSGEAEGARMAADASASVGAGMDNVRRKAAQQLAQGGININSGRQSAMNEVLDLKEVMGRSTAENEARVAGRDLVAKRMSEAAALGAPLIGQATSALSTGSAAGNAAVQNIQAPSDVARKDAELLKDGLDIGMKGLTVADTNRLNEKQIDNNMSLGLKSQNRADDKQDQDDISGLIEGIGTIWDMFS